MRSQERIKEEGRVRHVFFEIVFYICIFVIGLAFGEVITTQKLEPKILCYKYFNTTSHRMVFGKIQCKVSPGEYQRISQSQIDKYRRSN